MSRLSLFLVISCGLINLVFCKGYFTIVGSKIIRPNTIYHLSVSAHDFVEPTVLRVSINGTEENDKSFLQSQDVTLRGDGTQTIDFDLKNIKAGDYRLQAKSVSGIEYEKSVDLDLNTKKFSVFMQTDKSIYKPADKVQFRILILDASTRPYPAQDVKLYITDGGRNRIKQYQDITLVKGVYQNEFQLSDSPVLGNWHINIEVDGEESSKEFEVAEYVLPKYEVMVESDPHATYKDGKIRATVRAKYTYGKPVKGQATISAYPVLWLGSVQPFIQDNIVRKVIPVDGKGSAEFDITEELKIEGDYERYINIEAIFEEELTGRRQNGSTQVTIHKYRYDMSLVKDSDYYKPGLPYNVFVKVTYHDGAPVVDKTNPVKIITSYTWDDKNETEVEYLLDNHGMAQVKIDVPENTTFLSVKAKYLESDFYLGSISKARSDSGQYIMAKIKTEVPTINQEVSVDVLSTEELDYITYEILGRGDVLVSKTIPLQKEKSLTFKFLGSFAMVPKATLLVYYIRSDGQMVSDRVEVKFGDELQNFVKLDLSTQQAKPGEQLNITVSTKPNSYVGLLGVDQSVLILKKGNDIEKSEVFDQLEGYNTRNYYNRRIWGPYVNTYDDFERAGAVVLTNAKEEQNDGPVYYEDEDEEDVAFSPVLNFDAGGFAPSNTVEKPKIRKEFPETWIYDTITDIGEDIDFGLEYSMVFEDNIILDSAPVPALESMGPSKKVPIIRKDFPKTWIYSSFYDIGFEGRTTISRKVPDTITSWIITGFAIDPVTGLGLTKQPRKLNVFQPFFVSTNLPYSIKRGEIVAIPVVVFNYMESDQKAEVTLHNDENEFEFADFSNELSRRRKRATDTKRTKTILTKSNSGSSVSFMIKPLKVGHITIKVTATSAIAGDGVERQLLVVPEGVTQYMNKAILIDLRDSSEYMTNVSIQVPPNAIPDSTKIEASAVGDILGPTIKNIDSLIRMPYGCGEQNMLNFVPNIVVLDYLTNLKQLNPELEGKAKKYMESGYQRELTYKHPDGSYSAFGKSDKSGSTWLTAFVAKSFNQASKYILVEQDIISQALEWLSSNQAANGSFPEVGKVSHKDMQGGSANGIALTAYTLITFLENRNHITKYQNTINKALDYIVRNVADLEDNYALAIASYALQLAKHSSKDSFLSKLDTKSENVDGMKYWKKAVPESDKRNPWNDQPNSVNVEMSAYAMQAFTEAGLESDAVPILKWLVSQRNDKGGFQSTQDTVVGLQALSSLAQKIYVPDNNVNVVFEYNKGVSTQMNVNKENALILQKLELPSTVKDITLKATGRGFNIVQLSYRYNMNVTGAWPRFVIDPQVNRNSNQDHVHLTVCTSFVPDNLSEKSNMAVMEVAFPSGFTFDTDTTPFLRSTEKVKRVETKDGDTVVVVYFDDLEKKEICPVFKAFRTHKVAKQRPAPVVIYDYYDNSRKATQFYKVPESTLCDICEGDDCGETCQVKAQELTSNDGAPQKDDAGKGSAVMISSPLTLLTFLVILNFFKF